MILLDTNILSELMRPTPEVAVEQWLADQPAASVFISAITEAELRYGLALMPPGKRRSALAVEIENMLGEDFSGRILPFDRPADFTARCPDCRNRAVARSGACHTRRAGFRGMRGRDNQPLEFGFMTAVYTPHHGRHLPARRASGGIGKIKTI